MKTRVLITVKTYPTLSQKYGELVCTAGIKEDRSWVRIYPVPFRKLKEHQKYPKYSWMELDLAKNDNDSRPESFRPIDLSRIKQVGDVRKGDNWAARRELILSKTPIYENLNELIHKAKANELSLATFKPKEITDLTIEGVDREWDEKKLNRIKSDSLQGDLFASSDEVRKEFKVMPKLPYKFSYTFIDNNDRKSKLMIEDWGNWSAILELL